MPKINIAHDCSNSPRKLFLKTFLVALVNGKIEIVSQHITDSIIWDIAGYKQLQGKVQCLEALKDMPIWKARELTIETIITHGPDAAVSGRISKSKGQEWSFCEIYRFKSAGSFTLSSVKTFFATIKH